MCLDTPTSRATSSAFRPASSFQRANHLRFAVPALRHALPPFRTVKSYSVLCGNRGAGQRDVGNQHQSRVQNRTDIVTCISHYAVFNCDDAAVKVPIWRLRFLWLLFGLIAFSDIGGIASVAPMQNHPHRRRYHHHQLGVIGASEVEQAPITPGVGEVL